MILVELLPLNLYREFDCLMAVYGLCPYGLCSGKKASWGEGEKKT